MIVNPHVDVYTTIVITRKHYEKLKKTTTY